METVTRLSPATALRSDVIELLSKNAENVSSSLRGTTTCRNKRSSENASLQLKKESCRYLLHFDLFDVIVRADVIVVAVERQHCGNVELGSICAKRCCWNVGMLKESRLKRVRSSPIFDLAASGVARFSTLRGLAVLPADVILPSTVKRLMSFSATRVLQPSCALPSSDRRSAIELGRSVARRCG